MVKLRNWAIQKLGGVPKKEYEMASQRAFHERGLRESLEKKLFEAEGECRRITTNVRKLKAQFFYDPDLYGKYEKELLERTIRERLARSLADEIVKLIHIEDAPNPGRIRCATAFVRIYVEDET